MAGDTDGAVGEEGAKPFPELRTNSTLPSLVEQPINPDSVKSFGEVEEGNRKNRMSFGRRLRSGAIGEGSMNGSSDSEDLVSRAVTRTKTGLKKGKRRIGLRLKKRFETFFENFGDDTGEADGTIRSRG